MSSLHKRLVHRSTDGCCICRAKSSSSRFTASGKYEQFFTRCFQLGEARGEKQRESATGDQNSNGDAEQTVQEVEDETRTWKDALEDAIKDRIPPSHDILAWIIEHAASIDRRTSVGDDGKTPVERLRGRRGRDNVAELGENVLYIPLRNTIENFG